MADNPISGGKYIWGISSMTAGRVEPTCSDSHRRSNPSSTIHVTWITAGYDPDLLVWRSATDYLSYRSLRVLKHKQYQKQNFSESINQTTKWNTDLVENLLYHLEGDFPAFHRIQNALPCLQDPDPILNHLNPEQFYLKYT